MKELILSFFSNLGQKLALLLLAGTTLVTTGSAVSKLVSKPHQAAASASGSTGQNQNTNSAGVAAEVISPTATIEPTVTDAPTPIVTDSPIPTVTDVPTPVATEPPVITPSVTPSVTVSPTATSTLTPTPSVTQAPSRDGGDDDREDSLNGERYRESSGGTEQHTDRVDD